MEVRVKESERMCAMRCLEAIKLNQAELRGIVGWWEQIGEISRLDWLCQAGVVLKCQHDLQNVRTGKVARDLGGSIDRDGG